MGIIEVRLLGNGFAIGYLRSTYLDHGTVLTLHALDINFKMQFTHTGNNGFTGFMINKGFECRIFFGEPIQAP